MIATRGSGPRATTKEDRAHAMGMPEEPKRESKMRHDHSDWLLTAGC